MVRYWLADLIAGRAGTWRGGVYYSSFSRWDIGDRRCGWTPRNDDDSLYLLDSSADVDLTTIRPLENAPAVHWVGVWRSVYRQDAE